MYLVPYLDGSNYRSHKNCGEIDRTGIAKLLKEKE
jgi:hypothetical protein